MAGLEIAFFGIGFFGSFVVVHIVFCRLQGDSTNIEFWKTATVSIAACLILRYGLPVAESLLSLKGIALVACSVLLVWKIAGLLSELFWWEGLTIGVVASISFLIFYLGSAWAWSRVVGLQ